MSAQNLLIVLALAGFLLLMAEIFVPGMILGVLGLACLAGAVLIGYSVFGAVGGTVLAGGLGLVVLVGFVIWMNIFPRTGIGRRLMLPNQLVRGASTPGREAGSASMVGSEGEALTTLRPAGIARINGQRMDVVAEADFIARGTPIRVVQHDGMRVIVRAAPADTDQSPSS